MITQSGGEVNRLLDRCLVECHTRYVMLAKVKNKDTESVVSALIKQSENCLVSCTNH
jgi:hypothetical protein